MPNKMTKNKKSTTRTKKRVFYAEVLDNAEKMDFQTASSIDGMDDEITILRMKIKYILEKDPENVQLIMAASGMLARLVKTRYNMTKNQKKSLKEGIGQVLEKYAAPLAAALLGKKL